MVANIPDPDLAFCRHGWADLGKSGVHLHGLAQAAYGQRARAETVFSVIKRMFGPGAGSRSMRMAERELLYRVLAHDCHRACVLFSVFLLMISMKPKPESLSGCTRYILFGVTGSKGVL